MYALTKKVTVVLTVVEFESGASVNLAPYQVNLDRGESFCKSGVLDRVCPVLQGL